MQTLLQLRGVIVCEVDDGLRYADLILKAESITVLSVCKIDLRQILQILHLITLMTQNSVRLLFQSFPRIMAEELCCDEQITTWLKKLYTGSLIYFIYPHRGH